MSENGKLGLPPLVIFADDWGRLPSSVQHLARRLGDSFPILWVNTIGTRCVRADSYTIFRGFEKLRNWGRGLKQISERTWVIDAPMLPKVGGTIARFVNRRLVTHAVRRSLRRLELANPVVITVLPFTNWVLGEVGQRGLIYYCTDDFAHWPSADRQTLSAAEYDLQKAADIVLACSRELEQRHAKVARCVYFPHGVDFQHFAAARTVKDLPPRLAEIPSPRIGFFGLVNEKLDYELLTAIAKANSEASVVLIGPVYVSHCPTQFRELPNVHLLGQQPYEELPRWIAGLDVLTMPYVDNGLIRQSNPLKLRECLATGKPTVSVYVEEVAAYEPHVRIARTREDFVRAVGEVIRDPDSGPAADARQQAVIAESWEARAVTLKNIILSLYHEPSNARAG